MKTFEEFDESKYLTQEPFTILELSFKWGSLDQTLFDADSRTKNKLVKFRNLAGEIVEIKVVKLIYSRYVREDKKLGNLWKFIDIDNNEHDIAIKYPIKARQKTNPDVDPLGEEDWN